METYIELINAYLNHQLSKTETLAFENRLKTDTQFNAIYNEHLDILKGIERVGLLTEISKAKKAYVKGKWLGNSIFATSVIFLIIFVFLIVFNSDNDAKNELKELLDFKTELTQSFKVSGDSIVMVTGKKGTQITINPNDLQFQFGKDFNGENLNLDLIELTSAQDLLLANAQTISNEKWLISGGAFKINITSKGKSLILKENKKISVKFPKNTQEENMQIFYGNRGKNGYLNWEPSAVQLKKEKQYVIFLKDTFLLDEERTKAFGGVETIVLDIKIDTLGFMSNTEINSTFPELKVLKSQKDTLIVYKELKEYGEIGVFDSHIIEENLSEFINKKYSDSVLTSNDSKRINENNEKRNSFYESIEISQIGWINIDQYYNMKDRVKVNLENNLGFNFDRAIVSSEDRLWHETYLIDNANNTVLNVYSNEIDLPRNKSFTIISCCIKDDVFFVFRQTVKFSEDSNILVIAYKKRNKAQIESLFRL